MAQDETPREKLVQLRQRLDPLGIQDLRDLCFDLRVKYDDLPGEGAAAKARELIDYLDRRRRRIPELEHYLAHSPSVWQRLRRRPAILYPVLGVAILHVLIILTTSVLAATGQLGLVKQQAQKLGLFLESPPEGKNETLIVIANFYHSGGVTDTEAHNEIKRGIEKAKAELGFTSLRVEVEPTHLQADDQTGAEALGKRYNASIVIWGADTGVRVTVNFLNLKQPDFAAARVKLSETQRTQLANPSAYARFVTQDLPGQLTFLSLFAVGQSYFNQEQYDNSLKAIEKAVASVIAGENIDGLAEAYFRLGWLYQELPDNKDKAIANYDQALKLKPDLAEAYGNRGIAYHNKGDTDHAIADYDQALKLKSNLAEVYYNRGIACADLSEYDRAIANFDEAIKLRPDLAAACVNRGVAYLDKGDTVRAIANYDQALKLRPDLAEAYYNRGTAYLGLGKVDPAIADFDQALKLKPNLAEAYGNRGLAYADKGENDRAIADYDQAIKLKSDYVETYNNRGIAYLNKGEYDHAIADFDHALKLKPDYAEAYNNRGSVYNDKGDYDLAITDCDQALRLKPDLAEAYNNRGRARDGRGEYDRAIADYDQALTLKPNDAEARFNRGLANTNKGEYDRAIADFDQALELKPDWAVAYGNRGLAYRAKGDTARAIADFRRYLELLPNAPDRQAVEDMIQQLEAQK